MGYTKRAGTEITDFWPDDTDTTMYIETYCVMLDDLLNLAKKKWPTAELSQIRIEAQQIHTSCLYYDQYDSGDYTNFVVLTLEPNV